MIFNALAKYEEESDKNITPVSIVETFKEISEEICKEIKKNGREATIDDMYNIAYTATMVIKHLQIC